MRSTRIPAIAFLVTVPPLAHAQTLPASTVQQVLKGAAYAVIPPDSMSVPLVGTPTLPLIEVRINGRGPYRLLIDLGANVTLLRRDVVDASGSKVLVARATSDIVRVDSMRIGGALFKDVTVGSYRELDVDGVIGYNLLRSSSFALDFRAYRFAFNHRQLPRPDGVSVFAYSVISNTPFVLISLGTDSLEVNLDTGAAEWMTIPPRLQSDLHWTAPPTPGRTTHNNQTGDTQVLEGHLRDAVRLGTLSLPAPVVYINSSADHPWLGAAAMQGLVWTFDPTQHRLEVRANSSARAYE